MQVQQVTWCSFQLGPDTQTDPSHNAIQNLADEKGWTLEFTRQAAGDHDTLAQLAAGAGFPEDEVREVLRSGRFADDVRHDLQALQQARSEAGDDAVVTPKRSGRSAIPDRT